MYRNRDVDRSNYVQIEWSYLSFWSFAASSLGDPDWMALVHSLGHFHDRQKNNEDCC